MYMCVHSCVCASTLYRLNQAWIQSSRIFSEALRFWVSMKMTTTVDLEITNQRIELYLMILKIQSNGSL